MFTPINLQTNQVISRKLKMYRKYRTFRFKQKIFSGNGDFRKYFPVFTAKSRSESIRLIASFFNYGTSGGPRRAFASGGSNGHFCVYAGKRAVSAARGIFPGETAHRGNRSDERRMHYFGFAAGTFRGLPIQAHQQMPLNLRELHRFRPLAASRQLVRFLT